MLRQRKHIRLPGFDYTNDAIYFITSCVHHKECVFGEIVDEKILLNQFGKIAQQQWRWLINHYPYLISHAFIVMPNHIHALIEINGKRINQDGVGSFVVAGRDLPLQTNQQKIKSLSELIGAYKTTTSKKIHLAGLEHFQWQRSFYDSIVKDKTTYMKIKNYIRNNPKL